LWYTNKALSEKKRKTGTAAKSTERKAATANKARKGAKRASQLMNCF